MNNSRTIENENLTGPYTSLLNESLNEWEGTFPKLKDFKIGHLNIVSLIKDKEQLSVFVFKQDLTTL